MSVVTAAYPAVAPTTQVGLDAILTPIIGRGPASVAYDGSTIALTFTPDLSPQDAATVSAALADLATMARFGVTLTLAEWQAIKPDAALLKTYAGIASPTLAQTAAATKAQSRILAVIVRS